MFSKKLIAVFFVILCISGIIAVKMVDNGKDMQYKIGIIKVVDHAALDLTANGVINKLKTELQNVNIMCESAQSDNGLAQQIIRKFIQQDVNAIVTIGTTVTQIAMQQTSTVPIIFASVTDPISSNILTNINAPEGNITGVSNFAPNITFEQLQFYKKLMPHLKTIGVVYDSGQSNSIILIDKIKSEADKFNLNIKEIVASNTNDIMLSVKAFLKDVDVILVDNDNTALSAIKGIVDTSLKYNIPVLCSDTDTISLGVLAAVGANQYQLGEKAGDMVIKIVKNNIPIVDIPVEFATDIEYVVNDAIAKKFNLSIPENALIQK